MTNVPLQSMPTDLMFPDLTTAWSSHHLATLADNKCPSKSQDLTHSLGLAMTEAQSVTQTNVCTSRNTEHSCIKFWRNDSHNYDEQSDNDMDEYPNETEKVKEAEFSELQEMLNHVPSLPSRLRQRADGNNVNFILIATSFDQCQILHELGKSLESETSRVIPLTFKKENTGEMSKDASKKSETLSAKQLINNKSNESFGFEKQSFTQTSKRRHTKDTDLEYWESQNNSNSEPRMASEPGGKRSRGDETGRQEY